LFEIKNMNGEGVQGGSRRLMNGGTCVSVDTASMGGDVGKEKGRSGGEGGVAEGGGEVSFSRRAWKLW